MVVDAVSNSILILNDTEKEKAPSNKIRIKSSNMDIWVVGTSNQLSCTETKFSENKVVTGKAPFFLIGRFCTPRSICLNIGF